MDGDPSNAAWRYAHRFSGMASRSAASSITRAELNSVATSARNPAAHDQLRFTLPVAMGNEQRSDVLLCWCRQRASWLEQDRFKLNHIASNATSRVKRESCSIH
jgi:hypothetical protein